ncbi:hypothetical protein AKJ16_DCAP25751 [Drosera capensis]
MTGSSYKRCLTAVIDENLLLYIRQQVELKLARVSIPWQQVGSCSSSAKSVNTETYKDAVETYLMAFGPRSSAPFEPKKMAYSYSYEVRPIPRRGQIKAQILKNIANAVAALMGLGGGGDA